MSQVIPPREESPWMFWAQLLAGPVLWSVHFLISYLLVEAFCKMGWSFTVLGFQGISFIVIVLTVLAVIATVLFSLKSYRGWKRTNANYSLKDQFRDKSQWSEGFVYFSGFLLSVLFAVTILMVGLPALFLHPC
jgi:Ca2+/Na+ antiporter